MVRRPNNVVIDDIVSKPVEIKAICNEIEGDDEIVAYGAKRQVGPVGDVLDIDLITKNDKYNEIRY